MAITISGQNNNDKIVASDGVLDMLSGFNVVGVMTASSFDVGSNIKLGNAGIITATTVVGNVTGNLTGNVNHTSNLLLQISGSEKFRVGTSGQFGIAGANYGTSGQVLTSQGSGSAPQWATPSSVDLTSVTSNIVPDSDNARDLGTSSARWNELYIQSIKGNQNQHILYDANGAIEMFAKSTQFIGMKVNSRGLEIRNNSRIIPTNSGVINFGDGTNLWNEIHANTFHGDGSNLTGISAGTSLSGSTNNTVCTVTGANAIQGEANLTFDGTEISVGTGATISSVGNVTAGIGTFVGGATIFGGGSSNIDIYNEGGTHLWTVKAGGNIEPGFNNFFSIGDTGKQVNNVYTKNLYVGDDIIHNGDTNTKIRFPANDNISMEVAGSEVFKIAPDAAHGSSQSIRLRTTHTIDGAAVNMGGTKAYSGGIIRGLVNIRDGNAYNTTDNGGGLGFSAIYNSGGSHTTMSQIEGVKANNTDGNYEGAIKFATRHHNGNMVEKARIGLNGLSFQGDTAAANCLDDYEEGSYTANFEVTSGSANFHNNTLHYVKIGSMCYVHGEIGTNSKSSPGGDLRFDLPFTAKASGSNNDGHARGLVGAIWNYYGTSNPHGNYGWYPLHIQLTSGAANNVILYIVGYNSQNSNWGPIGNLIGSSAQIGISFTYRTA